MEKEHAPISAYYIVLSENNASLFDQTFVIIDEVDDRGKRLLLNYDGMGQILNESLSLFNKNNYGYLSGNYQMMEKSN